MSRTGPLWSLLLPLLLACEPGGRRSIVPPYNPDDYPCGTAGKVCPGKMCCNQGDACGGTPGCPAGECCFVGEGAARDGGVEAGRVWPERVR